MVKAWIKLLAVEGNFDYPFRDSLDAEWSVNIFHFPLVIDQLSLQSSPSGQRTMTNGK